MTDLEDALDCLRYDFEEESRVVDYGKRQILNRIINRRIESQTDFDHHEHKLSKTTIVKAYRETIIELADEIHGEDDVDLEAMFQEREEDVLRSTLSGEIVTFTFTFPLNLRDSSSIPDEFSTLDTVISRISEEKWKENYEQPAKDADETSLTAFLEESPNDLDEKDGAGGLFTFWKAEYDARDYYYALSRIAEKVRLLLGKLNFVEYHRSADVPQPARNTRPPNARWSQLKEPFVYLIFQNEEYLDYRPYDYNLRRSSEGMELTEEDRKSKFFDLPDFPADRTDREDIDESLLNAILAYQAGITEASVQQSFFAFWRGLENLTQVEQQESKQEVIDRAMFALENMWELDKMQPELKEAMEEVHDKRNELAHEGPHTSIFGYHRAASKVLLDALLELYFSYYSNEYTIDDFRLFLKYGAKSVEKRTRVRDKCKRTIDLMEDIQEFENNPDSN